MVLLRLAVVGRAENIGDGVFLLAVVGSVLLIWVAIEVIALRVGIVFWRVSDVHGLVRVASIWVSVLIWAAKSWHNQVHIESLVFKVVGV